MPLKLDDCLFSGPALPEPFVKFELEKHLLKAKVLPKDTGDEGKQLQKIWEAYRRKLLALNAGGSIRVSNYVFEPLLEFLGYEKIERQLEVSTREGPEDGGWLMTDAKGKRFLRCWSVEKDIDLDAPHRRGYAYRFSPNRVAHRVLLAKGERVGLLTDGEELRFLISDPARPESHISIRLDKIGGWRGMRQTPDSLRLLVALACPKGVALIPKLTDEARLTQTKVTKKLREQARRAAEDFIQEVLEQSVNASFLAEHQDKNILANDLWKESLILIYRLLFIFKLESSPDPARAFSFASTSLWRNTYSPTKALASYVRDVIDQGAETGNFLESSLRVLFRMFSEGLSSSELKVSPLGGMLFGEGATPLLDNLSWGERAVANLLDRLLWTPREGKIERQRVYYGPLDVEDLGRVYEALLELEPGITTEPMCRLRRAKLEVVVPVAQGEPYKNEKDKKKSGKTKVEWVEDISADRFYLRVGLGRKASGSYYTPHPFVRFLIQETLGPQIEERSPRNDPHPLEIINLKVLDPAMGSGHFLVEACRYLGDNLYEACRLCDELAMEAQNAGDESKAEELWQRVRDLPDPNDELMAYLPSRVVEGEESGLSQAKALAMCRRLVAVHCLYGVDKNPLAVELAKLSLWLESYAEGLPLTFLDHRLIRGDSLTGPFFEHLLTFPGSGESIENLLNQGLRQKLTDVLNQALSNVRDLEASIGKDVHDIRLKEDAKKRLDKALEPFKMLASAWSGGVMLGKQEGMDSAYEDMVKAIVNDEPLPEPEGILKRMINTGKEGVSYDLAFPEVFYPEGGVEKRGGFDAVVGNPPWERIEINPEEYFGQYDFAVLDNRSNPEKANIIQRLSEIEKINSGWDLIISQIDAETNLIHRLYPNQKLSSTGRKTIGRPDTYRLFSEKYFYLGRNKGLIGLIVPSSFHSNEGSTGIRLLYLTKTDLQKCYSFENKNLFEIHPSMKFDIIAAKKADEGTRTFRSAFYLHDMEWLFKEDKDNKEVHLTIDILKNTSPTYLTFIEANNKMDLSLVVPQKTSCKIDWKKWQENLNIETTFGVEIHRNPDFNKRLEFTRNTSVLFKSMLQEGWHRLPIHAGKTIFQYTDSFDSLCSNYVRRKNIFKARHWENSVKYYRFSFRMKAASTNERSMIAVLITPGFINEQTLVSEKTPHKRPNSNALLITGFANSYLFDYQVRQRITTSLSNYILAPIPIPDLPEEAVVFLSHTALRLSCNHEGYEPLWREQVGEAWREAPLPDPLPEGEGNKMRWPVLEGDDERWKVRAAIDAVVAQAYGLNREQYEYVLSTFSHKSYPKAPKLCLAAFDELQFLGLEAFCRKHDPYHDIPLNTNLPKPVIELPDLGEEKDDEQISLNLDP